MQDDILYATESSTNSLLKIQVQLTVLALCACAVAGFAPPSMVLRSSRLAQPANVQMASVGDACTGTCKWFDVSKGFGFITIDGEENDIFVHQTEIYAPGFRSLAENEKVEFKISADDRTGKLRAVEVTGPDGAYVQGAPRTYDDSYGDDEGY